MDNLCTQMSIISIIFLYIKKKNTNFRIHIFWEVHIYQTTTTPTYMFTPTITLMYMFAATATPTYMFTPTTTHTYMFAPTITLTYMSTPKNVFENTDFC